MSKIAEFKAAKAIAGSVAQSVRYCLGRDDPRNDKAYFHCKFSHRLNDQWTPMCFQMEAHYGYYGSSSGYNATSDELGRYLAMAINKHASVLLDYAAELAAIDAEKARKAAESEAVEVLKATEVKAA